MVLNTCAARTPSAAAVSSVSPPLARAPRAFRRDDGGSHRIRASSRAGIPIARRAAAAGGRNAPPRGRRAPPPRGWLRRKGGPPPPRKGGGPPPGEGRGPGGGGGVWAVSPATPRGRARH